MMNLSFFRQFIYYLIVVILIIGCGKVEPIKIGMVAGLSGRRSQLGVSTRNAVILAVQQVNENGGINGRPIELIVKDNKGDVAECKKVIKEIINDGAIAVIGPVMSSMAAGTIEAIAGKGVLVISPTISTTAIENLDDFFLRLMPVASKEAENMANIAIEDGLKKVAVVYDSSNKEYTLPIFKTFSEQILKNNGAVTYSNDMSDKAEQRFTRIAEAVIGSDSDAVYIISSGIDAAFLCQQIRKRNDQIQFYGSHWVKSGNIIEQGGKSVEGMVLVTPFEREVKSKSYLDFSNAHEVMFKAKPNFVAKYAYETAQVLFDGIRRSGKKVEASTIKEAILNIKTFEGLEEKFIINKYGDAIRSNTVLVIENGTFKRRS